MTQQNPDPNGRSPWRFLPRERHAPTLSPADAAALDAVVAEHAGSTVPVVADAERVERIHAWLRVLSAAPDAAPPANLVDKTLAAIERDRLSIAAQQNAPATPRRWAPSRHFGELATMAVAAGLMLAILIPGLGYVRQNAKRTACAANLAALGTGFAHYAADYSGNLPALPAPADHNWLGNPVATADGQPRGHSNTANLLPLVRLGYVAQDRLTDPARGELVPFDPMFDEIPNAARSYSYLNTANNLRPKWSRVNATFVLSDCNPLFARPGAANPLMNSFNHGRLGNNVLASDGSVVWTHSPNAGPDNDNIWTIQDNQTDYNGTELPTLVNDVFLAP